MKKLSIFALIITLLGSTIATANEVNILSKWRITSTFDLLETVEDVFLLVTGDNKNSILQQIGNNNSLPVNELINRRKKTTLITDQKI